MDNRTLVEIEGHNGTWFTISGPSQGQQGVILGTDLDGLYDAPVKTIYTEHAHQIGASYAGHRFLRRDIVFGVWIDGYNGDTWQFNDSEWRKAWSYDKDTKIWITTPESGRRCLKARLSEQPQFKPERDPNLMQSAKVVMTVVCGDPWWYEDDYTDTWVLGSGTSGSGFVTVENPTDQPIWMKWVLQGGARWTIPDFSFGDNTFGRADADKARKIQMPKQKPGQVFRIDTDPHEDMLRDNLAGSQVWSLMGGVTFNYALPAYTKPIQIPVAVTEADVGVGVQVRCPRTWSRPWGLE